MGLFGWGKHKELEEVEEVEPWEGVGMSQGQVWGTDCAWCLAEQGLELGNGSHGICDYHSAQFWQAYQDRRARQ
ncbi:MAG TPA: hypothetical protein VKV29_09605 [Chthonomonas sp.]|uniref:hypothetical protein n=1 Tax=Chthonomonas sp. TaxID=2282153 RepID=UPI002B4B58E1|nr:hypothetical protein [Chthonomonas sp.]HLG77067.1 hypothetical protein [Ktedonobacteraceae bacterium]HLH80522.1 hypothetical protein [Chthonomonas sp.]